MSNESNLLKNKSINHLDKNKKYIKFSFFIKKSYESKTHKIKHFKFFDLLLLLFEYDL